MTETNPTLDKTPDTDADAELDGAFVRTRGVSKSFHGRPVLKEADFRIGSGEIAVLIGKSGSGKSTLLRVIAGLEEPDAGDIDLAGQAVVRDGEYTEAWKDLRGQIGMIFQSYTLWPHMNVFDNLTVAPRLALGESKAQLLERAERALTEVGMAHHLRSRCTQLSGGERQRVAIARAIVGEPAIVLADEPTGALDTVTGAEVLDVLRSLHAGGTTVALITHDREIAGSLPRCISMRDGRKVADVTVQP